MSWITIVVVLKPMVLGYPGCPHFRKPPHHGKITFDIILYQTPPPRRHPSGTPPQKCFKHFFLKPLDLMARTLLSLWKMMEETISKPLFSQQKSLSIISLQPARRFSSCRPNLQTPGAPAGHCLIEVSSGVQAERSRWTGPARLR